MKQHAYFRGVTAIVLFYGLVGSGLASEQEVVQDNPSSFEWKVVVIDDTLNS